MKKFLFVFLACFALAQDPPVPAPTPGVQPFKEPVITINNISNEQLEGIKHRAAKDGPKGVDPLKWYLSRIEFELNLWAEESVAQNKEELGKDVEELLTEEEKKAIKEAVAKKKAEREAARLAKEKADREAAEAKAKADAEAKAAAEAAARPVNPGPPANPGNPNTPN